MRSGWASALVDFVDRDDDRNLRRFGVVDGFEGLRHHAVVGRHHQHHDVGDLGSAGSHAGERFMAGRVDEDDFAAVLLDVIGADVLRDPAGFLRGHVGEANGVQQRGLAVIDVAHDGDHGRALHTIGVSSVSSISCVLSSSKLTLLVEAPKSRARSSAIFTRGSG